eukprot:maker-scaffold_3-snap-gene-20.34-mRNA-1 protein AED:0.36 eAED:0.38 QI:0/1/0.5/1/1/1/2/50/169
MLKISTVPLSFHLTIGFGIFPLRTNVKGPALRTDGEDIVDEGIRLFRANILFASFTVEGLADRVLIYLTYFISQCLKRLEKAKSVSDAKKLMFELAKEKFPIPGDKNWQLGGHISAPGKRKEQEDMRKYMEQLRECVCERIVDVIFPNGEKNKFWMQFSKKKFMNIHVQ